MKWIERALRLSGICLLVWSGLVRLDTHLFHDRTVEALTRSTAPTRGTAATDGEPRPSPRSGAPLALLSIPRLGVEAAVAEGVSPAVLRRAVGHLPASARPGEIGNVVLAGHRDTHFRPLERIEVGDRIELRSAEGSHTYAVQWIEVVPPDRVDVARPTGRPALTLITCYPFRIFGKAPLRLVVRALPVASGGVEFESGRNRGSALEREPTRRLDSPSHRG